MKKARANIFVHPGYFSNQQRSQMITEPIVTHKLYKLKASRISEVIDKIFRLFDNTDDLKVIWSVYHKGTLVWYLQNK